MDVTQPPFDDLRVVQAFKLAQDRQETLEVVYNGQGDIACDTSSGKTTPISLSRIARGMSRERWNCWLKRVTRTA